MTQYTSVLILVASADVVAEARGFCSQVDPSGSTYQLFAALSTTGQAPATHYWCHWTMLPQQEGQLRGKLNSLNRSGKVRIFDGHAFTPQQAFTQLGLVEVADL